MSAGPRAMRLNREKRVGMAISVTPLVDVMMILLIFFMVTSTYLDLDMVPLVGGDRPADEQSSAPPVTVEQVVQSTSLLVRLAADGTVYVSGQAVSLSGLSSVIQVRVTTRPSTPVLVLPSGAATTQSLVSLMDAIANAGARNVRVVRLSPQ